MKTVYTIIKAIVQGVIFGIFFFGVGLLCFGLPFLPCSSPEAFWYFELSVIFSVVAAMVTGATWGWGVLTLGLEFDL